MRIVFPMLALMLAACSSSAGATFDPSSDVHCRALSIYFTRAAVKESLTTHHMDSGIASAIVMGDWWVKESRDEAASAGEVASRQQVSALYDKILGNFEEAKSSYKQCVARAGKDPAFDMFVRTLDVQSIKMPTLLYP